MEDQWHLFECTGIQHRCYYSLFLRRIKSNPLGKSAWPRNSQSRLLYCSWGRLSRLRVGTRVVGLWILVALTNSWPQVTVIAMPSIYNGRGGWWIIVRLLIEVSEPPKSVFCVIFRFWYDSSVGKNWLYLLVRHVFHCACHKCLEQKWGSCNQDQDDCIQLQWYVVSCSRTAVLLDGANGMIFFGV